MIYVNSIRSISSKHEDLRVAEENTVLISILNSNSTSFEDINTLDPSFMYSQLLKEILFGLHYNHSARNRFTQI